MPRQFNRREVMALFERCGFREDRTSGSHTTMKNQDGVPVTVSGHGSAPIPGGTLRKMFNTVAAALPPEAGEVLMEIHQGEGRHRALVKRLETLLRM